MTVDEILAKYPGPIRLESGREVLTLIISTVIFIVAGIPLAMTGIIPVPVVFICAVILIAIVSMSIWAFPAAFILDDKGLTSEVGPFRRRRPWKEISDFVYDERLKSKWAIVAYKDPFGTNRMMKMYAKAVGHEALLGVRRGITGTQLATLLNGWRERALANSGGASAPRPAPPAEQAG